MDWTNYVSAGFQHEMVSLGGQCYRCCQASHFDLVRVLRISLVYRD